MSRLRHRPCHVLSSFAAPDNKDVVTIDLIHASVSFRRGRNRRQARYVFEGATSCGGTCWRSSRIAPATPSHRSTVRSGGFNSTPCCSPAYRSIQVALAGLIDPIRRPEPESATLYLPCVAPGY